MSKKRSDSLQSASKNQMFCPLFQKLPGSYFVKSIEGEGGAMGGCGLVGGQIGNIRAPAGSAVARPPNPEIPKSQIAFRSPGRPVTRL